MTADRSTRGRLLVLAVVLALAAACSTTDAPDALTDDGVFATTPPPTGPVVPVGPTEPAPEDDDPGTVDDACLNYRALIAPSAPCDALVGPSAELTCAAPGIESIGCTSVPSAVRIGQVSGAVLAGPPIRPGAALDQLGPGAGPTNVSLLLFTGAPLPKPSPDRLEVAIVFTDAGGVTCSAPGEAWDGASFVSVLRLGPDEVRVDDLACRPDGFSSITQRSTWLLGTDLAIVHLPIDLPGTPAQVTGSFRPAPAFDAAAARFAVRPLEATAWDFDAPISP